MGLRPVHRREIIGGPGASPGPSAVSGPLNALIDLPGKAVQAIGRMPSDTQESIARAMLDGHRLGTAVAIEPADPQGILEDLDKIARGEIARDDAVKAIVRRCGLCVPDEPVRGLS